MALKRYLSGLLLGLGTMTAIGCAVDPPPPPDPPFSQEEVKGLLACQTEIKKQGREFLNTKVKNLEECADDMLEIQLSLESQLITEDEFNAQLPAVRTKCQKKFAKVTSASTKLVDKIIAACEPVEDVLLGSDDPLLFQGLLGVVSSSGEFCSVEQIAGWVCTMKELAADFAVSVEVPRLHSLLETLGPDFLDDEIGSPGGPIFLPNIPLDDRCLLFSSPLPSCV